MFLKLFQKFSSIKFVVGEVTPSPSRDEEFFAEGGIFFYEYHLRATFSGSSRSHHSGWSTSNNYDIPDFFISHTYGVIVPRLFWGGY